MKLVNGAKTRRRRIPYQKAKLDLEEIKKKFFGMCFFSIKNKVNGQLWTGHSRTGLYYDIGAIIKANRWYCERSELNKQLHEYGIKNFEVSGAKCGTPIGAIELTEQERHPFKVPGVYAIYDTLNLKVYVGASSNIEIRAFQHFSHGFGNIKTIIKAMSTFGPDNFHPIILEVVRDLRLLGDRELYWIDKLDAIGTGYNTNNIKWDYVPPYLLKC